MSVKQQALCTSGSQSPKTDTVPAEAQAPAGSFCADWMVNSQGEKCCGCACDCLTPAGSESWDALQMLGDADWPVGVAH